MHSFTLTEMFQKCFINACPWVNPYPYMGIHASGYIYAPREPNLVLHGYLLHFAADKFSRTKVCDIYPLAERVFLISQIWDFLRLSPKLAQNHLETFWKRYIYDSVVGVYPTNF